MKLERRTGRLWPRLLRRASLTASIPLAYQSTTLTAVVKGHKQSRIDELLPWHYPVL